MGTRGKLALLLMCCTLSLSSCGYALRLEGAKPLLTREEFEAINLPELIDPENAREKYMEKRTFKDKQEREQAEIEAAFRVFRGRYAYNAGQNEGKGAAKDEDGKLARNHIQERLIAASKHRCGEYITKIKGGQAWSRFGFGVFTTMVTGVSAVVTGGAATALAAVGAVSSGSRAEMDAQLFAEKTVEVIASGIDRRREKLYKAIKDKQGKNLREYNLAAAIGDAVEYHAACTLSAGLSEVGESITVARDPGLKRLGEILGIPERDLVGPVRDAMLEEQLRKLKELRDKEMIDDTSLKDLQKKLIEERFRK